MGARGSAQNRAGMMSLSFPNPVRGGAAREPDDETIPDPKQLVNVRVAFGYIFLYHIARRRLTDHQYAYCSAYPQEQPERGCREHGQGDLLDAQHLRAPAN